MFESSVIEVVAAILVPVLIGAAVGRWWIVPVPAVLAALWFAAEVATYDPADDREGTGTELAVLAGGTFAFVCTLGLGIGVIVGRLVRDKRRERVSRPVLSRR